MIQYNVKFISLTQNMCLMVPRLRDVIQVDNNDAGNVTNHRHVTLFLSYRIMDRLRYVSVPRDASWMTHGSQYIYPGVASLLQSCDCLLRRNNNLDCFVSILFLLSETWVVTRT